MEYDGHPSHQLDGLDFAGDVAILFYTQQQMQDKTNIVAEYSARLGLNIHRRKRKILKVNSTSAAPITLGVEAIEEVDHFKYLGSVNDMQGRTKADVKARIGKAKWSIFN